MPIKFLSFRAVSTAMLALISGAASLSFLPSSNLDQALIAMANPVEDISISTKQNAPLSGYRQYTEPNLYVIDYPEIWIASKLAPNVTAIQNRQPSGSYQGYPPNYINTEIYFRSESLEAALQHLQRTNDRRYQPGTLTRKGELTVGGKEAVRLWFQGGQFGEDRIITLVRYSNSQTAVISSYFTSGETWGIPIIKNIHWSFRSN